MLLKQLRSPLAKNAISEPIFFHRLDTAHTLELYHHQVVGY